MRRLRKSDIRTLNDALPVELSPKQDVQEGDDVLLIDGRLSFIRAPEVEGWVPALPLLLEDPSLYPRITVDMGAVRFVTRGADIMRPGITAIEDVEEGGLVVVVDETHGKPLAVGQALVGAAEMRAAEEGRVVRTLHYVGDRFWSEYTG